MIAALTIATKLKIAATAAGVLVLVGSCVARDMKIETRGAEKAVAKITRQANEHGTQAAKRAEKKHDAARQPGSFERLRRDPKTCADCDR